ncbi:MAG: hypothetical protein IJZ79_03455 [Bacilli bacterium]|nr:hypothetical protein [Bacilli bacterium]MBQ8218785.1 hypothetical protein [Bacilli bacterium]
MNIYLTVHVQDLNSEDFDYAVYKATKRLLEKETDRYIPSAPSHAIVDICKVISDNIDQIFDTNISYDFDVDFAGEDIEEASIEKLISFITKTLIKMFRDDIIYSIDDRNILEVIEYVVNDNGDMILFKSSNYALILSHRGYNTTIIQD